MKVCDICRSDNVMYNAVAVVKENGEREKMELCPICYKELECRERQHKYLAYAETVQARTGKIPHKSHWWNWISW
jgi:hypothetical protein